MKDVHNNMVADDETDWREKAMKLPGWAKFAAKGYEWSDIEFCYIHSDPNWNWDGEEQLKAELDADPNWPEIAKFVAEAEAQL